MDEDYWSSVTALRLRTADFLEQLEVDEWDAPSLCPGWRVRDVAGHLSLVPTITLRELVKAAPGARFDVHRINTRLAVRYGSMPPSGLVARIREHASTRRTARGLSTANSLFDLAVHSQDMAVPLGRTFTVPIDAALSGLERVWTMGWPFHARRRFAGLTLSATDGPWSVGNGPEVRGCALDLLLLLTGRAGVAARGLEGPGLARALA